MSLSPGPDDSADYLDAHGDEHSEFLGETSNGKGKRKKNPTSQAARRDQNRIAQREFRLRKQQRIRDLEARVELLSGSKEESFTHFRAIIRGLMEENASLRNLVRDLSGFIGEGLGGSIARAGWDMASFREFIDRGDTDTAFEAFTNAKKARQQSADTNGSGSGATPAAGTANGLGYEPPFPEGGPHSKRKRTTRSGSTGADSGGIQFEDDEGVQVTSRSRPFVSNPGGSTGSSSNHPDSGLFSSLLSSSTAFTASPTTTSPTTSLPNFPQTTPNPAHASGSVFHTSLAPQLDLYGISSRPPTTAPPGLTAPPYNQTPPNQQSAETTLPQVDVPEQNGFDAGKNEAVKLIRYHLNNYQRTPTYHLPASLRPTLVQRTVPHDRIIDAIIIPELRNRLILLKDRFDLAECLHMFGWSTKVHGDDVLTHTNWEMSEEWLMRYGFLVDESLLATCNRWRRERGERELLMAEISSEEHGHS